MEQRRPDADRDLWIMDVVILCVRYRRGKMTRHYRNNVVSDHQARNIVSGFVGVASEFDGESPNFPLQASGDHPEDCSDRNPLAGTRLRYWPRLWSRADW